MRRDDRDPSQGTRYEDSVTTPLEVVLTDRENPDAERLAPKDMLAGRFAIRQWIASGGMGDVYRAYDRELDGEVAIKTIRREIVSEVRAMERFRREISLARQVTHANVCRVFDIFHRASVDRSEPSPGDQDEALTFLTMELLDGLTLSEWAMQQGPLRPEQAYPIVEQMVAGLEAAHEVGVIHRDFKCSNVILCRTDSGERRAVVTDFGLARRFLQDQDPATEITAQGEIVGSPAYMAPEQILGDPLTPATDVYALGVVMFRLMCGRLPFKAHGTMEVLAQRLHRDPPRPRDVMPELDPRWDAAIHGCLAREPEQRIAFPREVLWELVSRPVEVAPSSAEPTPAPVPQQITTDGAQPRSLRGLGKQAWALGLVVSMCLAGLGFWRFGIQHSAPASDAVKVNTDGSSVAVLGFKNLSRRAESEWLAIALTELLTTELASDGQVRVVPADDVAQMRQELGLESVESLAADTLQRIRLRLGSRYVVSGSYFVTGPRGSDSLRLDLRVQETEAGADIQGLSETAPQEKLLDIVQRVGHQLRPRLAGAEAADALVSGQGVPEGATMPSSLEATRLYVQGLNALRSFDGLRARDLLLEAEALDGDFPLILEALAGAYGMLGYDLEARDKIRRAHELSGDLTLRERRHIEGAYREWNADWYGAGEIYRTLFELFPDRLDYGLDLVRVQIEGGQRHEAESTLIQLRALPFPDREDPRIDLKEVEHALSIGLYRRAIDAAERVIEKGNRIGSRLLVARTQMHLSLAQQRLGRVQQAQDTVRRAQETFLELGDRSGVAAALNRLGGLREGIDPQAARRHYTAASEIYRGLEDRRGLAGVALGEARIDLTVGDFEASRRRADKALELSRDLSNSLTRVKVLGFQARLEYVEGRWEASRAQALEALRVLQQVQRASPLDEAEIHGTLSRAQLALGNREAAREVLSKAQALAVPSVRASLNENLEVLESTLWAMEGRVEDAKMQLQRALDENPPQRLRRRLELSLASLEIETCLFPEADVGRNLTDLAETAQRFGFLRLADVAESMTQEPETTSRLDICAAIKAASGIPSVNSAS